MFQKLYCTKCKTRRAENRYQICAACRTITCQSCGKRTLAKKVGETLCHGCRDHIRKNKDALRNKLSGYEEYGI